MKNRNTVPDVWRNRRGSHPLREMNHLQRRMDRIFDQMMVDPVLGGLVPLSPSVFSPETSLLGPLAPWIESEALDFIPAADLEETDEHYLISFDLPGVKKEDVKLELRDNQLIVSGERKEEKKHEKGSRLSEERVWGTFMRSFTLPSSVHADKVDATFENGVLRISMPKQEIAQSKHIPIKDIHNKEVLSDESSSKGLPVKEGHSKETREKDAEKKIA